tara:strand:+ start:8621 stop:9175 length:555 start_codon:yes stop_codon:yes gene_type:complete
MALSIVQDENLSRKTKNLTIRPLEKKDGDLLESKDNLAKMLQEIKNLRVKDQEYHISVFNTEESQVLGSLCLRGVCRDRYQSAMLEVALNQKETGDYLLMEMIVSALDISFHELQLNRVEVLAVAEQIQLQKVMLNIGLRKEGVRKYAVQKDTIWKDADVFAISASEYKSKNIDKLMNARINLR